MNDRPLIMLAAGGTGGHLFPAEALSHALAARGLRVVLVTDSRAGAFAGDFPTEAIHAVPSATPSGRGLLAIISAGWTLLRGVLASRALIRKLKPAVVVGFGGYPTVPPLMAATMLDVPSLIHEQNGVLGRANRALSSRVSVIASGFAKVAGLSEGAKAKCRHVGNPVRPAVIAVADQPMPPLTLTDPVHLLVFGGSQGARVMADIVPPALALLPAAARARLHVVQQARDEDGPRVREAYAQLGIAAEIAPFFKDLPARMAQAHLVIGRSGASTVAELGVIGRASLLVPLPGALDQDQAANALVLADAGAALMILQPDFTPERLAAELSALLEVPARLTAMAAAAKSAGIPDAANRLAAVVCEMAGLFPADAEIARQKQSEP